MKFTAAVGALIFSASVFAQLPRLEWQNDAATTGDGTRSYILRGTGSQVTVEPGLNAAFSVPTADGAYLVIPTNSAGGSDYLRFLYTPFLPGTKGFQVVKLNEQGQLLWQRFVPIGYSDVPQPLEARATSGVTLAQTRLTLNGGLALLAGGEYVVMDSSGVLTLRLASYCSSATDFALIDANLNEEGLLIASTPRAQSAASLRACAIDRNGVELDRIQVSAAELALIDFRRDVGFLVKHGSSNLGVWTNARLELRTNSLVRWSKSGSAANTAYSYFGPAISPSGEVWTYSDGQFTRLDASGTPVWQLAAAPLANARVQAWLNDGSALLDNPEQVWRVIAANGTQRWQRDLGQAFYVSHRLGASELSVVQWGVGAPIFRHHSIDLLSGAVQSNDRTDDIQTAMLTLAPLGPTNIVDVRFATPSLTRNYFGSCAILGYSGFCVREMSFATVETRVRSAGGGPVSLLPSESLAFALPSYPFETSVFPSLRLTQNLNGIDAISRIYTKRYVHDGVRSQVQIQRLTPGGNVLWTRTFGAEFDVGKAALRDLGTHMYVSAQTLPPENAVSIGRVWSINPDTGAPVWTVQWPSAWQRVDSFTLAPARVCGLSQGRPYRVQCVNRETGAIVQDQLVQGVAVDAQLIAIGRADSSALRVRQVSSDGRSSGFFYANLGLNGVLSNFSNNAFSVQSGESAVADARWGSSTAGDGSFFATAAVLPTPTAVRPSGLLVARFDPSGNRVWQTRIDRELRGFLANGESTSVAETANGEVYIALHPRTLPVTYKTELCKLSASGTLLGCFEAPTPGRISALLPDGNALRVWINATDSEARLEGAALYQFQLNAFSPRELLIPDYASASNNSIFDFVGRHYLTLVARRTAATQTDSAVRVISVVHTPQDLMFADGWEE